MLASASQSDFNHQVLNPFLFFSYIPRFSDQFLRPVTDDMPGFIKLKRWMENASVRQLESEGSLILDRVFRRQLSGTRGEHVVPLSGGIDSRLILAQLIEVGLRNKIVAVSYGCPGSYDYEFSQGVAEYCGVAHHLMNLQEMVISEQDLKWVCENGGAYTPLFDTFYNWMVRRLFSGNGEATIWTGFLGGGLAGALWRPGYDRLSYVDAKREFLRRNWWMKPNGPNLHSVGFNVAQLLPAEPVIHDSTLVSYPEQMNLGIRQISFIKTLLLIATTDRAPFADPEWIRFMLAAPAELRRNCRLYHYISVRKFPELFGMKTTSAPGYRLYSSSIEGRIGSILMRAKRKLPSALRMKRPFDKRNFGYIDYSTALKERDDLGRLFEEALARLGSRDVVPWIDPPLLWKRHRSGVADLQQALRLLVSLEYSLGSPMGTIH